MKAQGTTWDARDARCRTWVTRDRARSQRGIMLVDCLVYLALWAVVVGLAFAAFYRCLSYSTDLARNADDIARVLKAGERWRKDVREATGPVSLTAAAPGVGQALHIPQKGGEVIYLFVDGAVLRRSGTNPAGIRALNGVKSSRMEKDERQRIVCWRWEVELKNKQKAVRVRPLFTFQAVPAERKVR
jgi:hypothetical protein